MNFQFIPPERKERIRNVWKTSLRLVKLVYTAEPFLFCLFLGVSLLPGILPFVSSYVYKLIIDTVVAILSGNEASLWNLSVFIGIAALIYMFQNIIFNIQSYVEVLLYTKIPILLNERIYAKISNLDIQHFENSDFKNELEKVRESLSFRPQNLFSNIIYALQSFVQISVACIAIAHLNWILLFIIALTSLPEFIVRTRRSEVSWGIWSASSETRKRFWYLADLLQVPATIKELKIFQLTRKFLDDMQAIQLKYYKENAKVAKANLFYNSGASSISIFIAIGVEIYVIFQALQKRLTVGDIEFYRGVVTNFGNGLSGLFRNITNIFESSLYVQSIFTVLDTERLILDDKEAVPLDLQKPLHIALKNVSFAYPDSEKKVLNNISITITPGEHIAFIGENGAGKSTIIKLLLRLYDVSEGEILIQGINIKQIQRKSLYKAFGVLFQDFTKYEYTVKENIYFGDVTKSLEVQAIHKAAAESDADEFIKKFSKQYDQVLGKTFEEGQELSIGQWQKIALARAFFRNAPILILDEPTAAIDARAEAEIFESIQKLQEDKTVVIISHRFSTVKNADRIIVLDNGKIAEEGSHTSLMELDGIYAELFTLQAKGYQ